MKLGELRESIEEMIEEAELNISKAKECKLRIAQEVYDGEMNHIRTDEKEIVGIRLDSKAGELIISVADAPM